MFNKLIDRILGLETENSRISGKNRLQLVIASDRSSLSQNQIENMRKEIIEVVSRYVEIDSESLEFTLENNQRNTCLVANLPIKRIKPDIVNDYENNPIVESRE